MTGKVHLKRDTRTTERNGGQVPKWWHAQPLYCTKSLHGLSRPGSNPPLLTCDLTQCINDLTIKSYNNSNASQGDASL
jgi:hypothetical protein